MFIVLPVHHFPPRYSAGAELYTFRLARWLIQHGHQAEVVCVEHIDARGAGPLCAQADVYDEVPVWRLNINLRGAPDAWIFRNPAIGEWFASYLDERQPDLVHLQSGYLITPSVLEATQGRGIITAVTLHDFWFLCPRITLLRGDGSLCAGPPDDPAACVWCERLASRRYSLPDRATGGQFGRAVQQLGLSAGGQLIAERRAYLRAILGRVDVVIAPSHFLAKQFHSMVAPERLHVLRYGLGSAGLAVPPVAPAEGELRLAYIGQIAPHKGVHTLVDAVRRLSVGGRPWQLTIWGDLQQHPNYTERLRRSIGADPRIQLAGRFENSRIAEVLGACHATVVPSLWYENSPLAIMEAHAAGRPVLTSALGGMAELVRDEVDGLHFQPGDAEDLAKQIERLRNDPALLGRLAGGTAPPATINAEMAVMLEIYERLTASRSATAEPVPCALV
jgi:glycosyltransferase involved in cell wall biosynthesis